MDENSKHKRSCTILEEGSYTEYPEKKARKRKTITSNTDESLVESISDDQSQNAPAPREMQPIIAEHGDLVWGKITSHPWWPGLVISHKECCQKAPKEGYVWIFWLGDHTFSEVALKNMTYFFECEKTFFEKFPLRRPYFKEGLTAAIQMVRANNVTGDQHDNFKCWQGSKPTLLPLYEKGWNPDLFTAVHRLREVGLGYTRVLQFVLFGRTNLNLAAERSGTHLDASTPNELLEYALKTCLEEDHPKQISGPLPNHVTEVLFDILQGHREKISETDSSCAGSHEDEDFTPETEEITSIVGICLACRKRDLPLEYNHPMYEGKVCHSCKERVKKMMFAVDEENKFYCSVCTRKGNLECVTCPRTFCGNCADVYIPNASKLKRWKCLVCEPANRNGGLLVLRANFVQEVTNLFTRDVMEQDLEEEMRNRKRPITVLSIFDGISTGFLVLKKIGISVKTYYACEIDETAITVSKARFGASITHLGDVKNLNASSLKKLGAVDLLIGGSPCNDLSLVNPSRKGFSDIDSTALLFYEYYRVLQQVQKHDNFFWLFENTANMPNQFEQTINRFLQSSPKKIDARFFSAHNRARFFWGNIPAIGETVIPDSSPNLNDVVSKTYGRMAQVEKMRTITTNTNSLMGQGPSNMLPVVVDGKAESLWITEVEEIFGFPRHFTDIAFLSRRQRLYLLGRAWSVQVIEYILRPLKMIFAIEDKET